MIPLKTFGLFLCKRAIFPKKPLNQVAGIYYDAFVKFPFDERLCSSPAGRPLYQRQQTHLLPLIYLLCGHRMTPQNNTRGLFFCAASLHAFMFTSCQSSFFHFSFFASSSPGFCKNIFSFSRETALLLWSLFWCFRRVFWFTFFKTIYYLLYQMGSVYCCLDSIIFHYFFFFC